MSINCVSIGRVDAQKVLDELSYFQAIELRLDLFETTESIFRAICQKSKFTLAACRTGDLSINQATQRLLQALDWPIDAIDIEWQWPAEEQKIIIDKAQKQGVKIVLSHHDYQQTPDYNQLIDILNQVSNIPHHYIKLVTTLQSKEDMERLMSLYLQSSNLIAFGMGSWGAASRIEALRLGAPWVYTAFDMQSTTAVGQWNYKAFDNLIQKNVLSWPQTKILTYPTLEINGTIQLPASKSILQRALLMAALSEGETVLENVSWSDDSLTVLHLIQAMGAKTKIEADTISIQKPIQFNPIDSVNISESGLALRMSTPVLAAIFSNFSVTGQHSILQRPQNLLIETLQHLGYQVENKNGFLPLQISGTVQNFEIEMDAKSGSQVLTGVLMAMPLWNQPSKIKLIELNSQKYVDLTIDMMQQFGVGIERNCYHEFWIDSPQQYQACRVTIEADWSAAAFWLVAAAVKGNLTLKGLKKDSLQADQQILEVLSKVGAIWHWTNENHLQVIKNELNAFEFDATHCPDLFPPLVALASACTGRSVIKGANRLVHKESNRAAALLTEFSKMGVSIQWEDDVIVVEGTSQFSPTLFETYGDHRMAMTGALMALISGQTIVIPDTNVVAKSYPEFFANLESLLNI